MIAFSTVRKLMLAMVFAGLAGCAGVEVEYPSDRVNAPYVPSPETTVRMMLDMARAGPGDVLYDLGSGDGRIPIVAASHYGVSRAIGIDINPELVKRSNENARKAGVADRVRFMTADIFKTDFRDATVVTLYLLQDLNLELRPRLLRELKVGTRVVSHRFDLGNWVQDEYRNAAQPGAAEPEGFADDDINNLYMWVVPADASGEWRLTAGGESYVLHLRQIFQEVEGMMSAAGASGAIQGGRLRGEALRFEARLARDGRAVALQFVGRVDGGTLVGTLTVDGRPSPASGMRAPRS